MHNPIPNFDRAEFLRDASPVVVRGNQFDQLSHGQEDRTGNHAAYVRAVVFGFVAAIAGCALYATVQIATGWTIGYVALAVGYMVGKAMKAGSSGRGGRRYQIAAALLTYAAVSIAAVPVALHGPPARTQSASVQTSSPSDQTSTEPKHGLPYVAGELVLVGLASPFMELTGGFSGIIGLFILFVGIRGAWQLTGGSETPVAPPLHSGAPGSPRIL